MSLSRSYTPTARKPHRCDGCGTTIQPGTQYDRWTGLYDVHFATTKHCLPCNKLRSAMYRSGWWSEDAGGADCYPWLPEVDYWDDVRKSPGMAAQVDDYHARRTP